ncbi:MAG: serine/threonine protein kinase, partial [Myxococcota bacterium]
MMLRVSDAAPGLQIDGWTLDRVLGEGGTAVVYAAHRTDDPSRGGALKLTRDTVTSVTAARIAHEARVLREATHPSLPTLEDAGTWQGRPYVVTGVVHGLSLELCVTWPPLSAPRSARLVLDLATVLQYLHARDVVHRDVKPANVRVTAEGRAVLLDFGAAVASDQTRLTVDGRAPATPSYAPPEWFDGRPVGPEGDLYALGVTLHELLTGDPAFDTVDPAQLRAAKQRGPLDGGTTDHGALSALVRRLTAPDPGARGPLAEAVATLERVAAPRGPVALPGTVGGLTTFFGEEAEEEEAAAFRQGPEVGDVLAGFRLVDRVGRGGMGEVWVAEQSRPRRRVALKTLHPERVSAFARGRFRFEAEALGQLLHPGIPQVYAAGEDRGRLFLAMELVDGHTLDQWVADGPSVADRVDLLAAICDAVHHAHLRGILHRDLKPANILVTDAGVPKVLDFGIAQALDGGSAGSRAGTPAYMSPEQFAGRPLDVRSDVYALGVVAFELLTGDRPGPAERLADRHPTLAGDLDAIVGTALAHDPDHRYASAQELAADLRRHRADVPVLARDPAWTYRVGRWLRRNALLAAAIAATTLGLGGVTTTSAWSAMTLSAAFQVE